MTEAKWVDSIASRLRRARLGSQYEVVTGHRLPYGYEITRYSDKVEDSAIAYETDLLISEIFADGSWKPRVILEAKINSINTHDAITYSNKAEAHRRVHPYLRYGVILGNRREYPLPGRLYRHGTQFDLMVSFQGFRPTRAEWKRFREAVGHEIEASQAMEKILYESRKKGREHFTLLQKRLVLK